MKRGLLTIAILVLFILSAMIAVAVLVDPNDYKDQLTEAVFKATGRNLHIDSDIKLSVFPWLGLELNQVSLDNPPDFSDQYFAQMQRLNIKVALLPLLALKVRVGEIQLKGLRVNLERRIDGLNNWDDLIADSDGTTTTEAPAAADKGQVTQPSALAVKEFFVGGIDIEDAQITWRDAKENTLTQIEYFNLETGAIRAGDVTTFGLRLALRNETPKVIAGIEMSGVAGFDLVAQRYSLDKLKLNIKASGAVVPGNDQDVAVKVSALSADLEQQTLKIDSLEFETKEISTTLKLDAKNILSEKIVINGDIALSILSIRSLLTRMAQPVPLTADKESLGRLELNSKFKGGLDALDLKDFRLEIDGSALTGEIAVQSFSTPAYRYKLNLDQLNADRYLPPSLSEEVGDQVAMGEVNLPVNSIEPELPVPVEMLRDLNATGEFQIGAMQIMNLKLSAIDTRLNAKNGLVELKPLKIKLYEGGYDGSFVLDVTGKSPLYNMQFKLAGVQAGSLMQDYMGKRWIDGGVNLDSDITTYGTTVDQLTRGLGGDLSFAFSDGKLNGINLAESIREVKAKLDRTAYQKQDVLQQTEFGKLSGTAVVKEGVISNADLKLEAKPHIFVEGQGSIDLVNESILYLLETSYFENDSDKNPDYAPVRIKGAFSGPKISIDWQRIKDRALEKKKAELKNEKSAEVEVKKKEAEEKLKKKAEDKKKDLLKRLFH
ncbi:MAG: AsmA family protein [Gammaproteobacteria bacterium]|nr:AsmA family protein [Gammaproteobacteria bacterium]